jgi:hypothetical protein
VRPNFSSASVTRAAIGATVCSASLYELSVRLRASATAFSNELRARLVCRSITSFAVRAVESARHADTVASTCAWAVDATCFERSWTPASQIWPDFITASRLPWPNETSSSAVRIALSISSFTRS